MTYKILFVEDEQGLIDSLNSTVRRIRRETSKDFDIISAKSVKEAVSLLSTDIDYAIIDIKLDGEETGDIVLNKITDEYRIPAYVLSGTPDIEESLPYIKIYKKGQKSHEEILKDIAKEIDTGLFKVMGSKGIIEKTMNGLFWKNLYSNIEVLTKISDSRDEGVTEKIILRYTIAHLQELLDQEIMTYEPIEMYVQSQKLDKKQFKTGEVLYNIDEEKYYIILSPACDLVLRNGAKPKIDNIILVEILDASTIFKEKTEGLGKNKKQSRIENLLKNNFSNNLYWLPESDLFSSFKGGFIDFRNITPISFEALSSEDSKFKLRFKLQEHFVKNVLNQFSVYYGRQGQPDFNFSELAENICQSLEN